MDSMASPAFVT